MSKQSYPKTFKCHECGKRKPMAELGADVSGNGHDMCKDCLADYSAEQAEQSTIDETLYPEDGYLYWGD